MTGIWQRLRALPWWAISLSLGINIIVLGAVTLAIQYSGQKVSLIVTVFLFVHIFITQPLKDLLVRHMGLKRGYAGQTTFLMFENRVQRILRIADILDFLTWMLRAWKLKRVRLIVFDSEDHVYFVSPKKRVRKMRLKDEISEEFRAELASVPGGRSAQQTSPELRAYLVSRKVKFFTPLLFRDRLIGVLGFTENIEKARLPLLDHAGQRIGLALENEQLERTVPRSEFLKKEFRLAERIEQHLSGASRYEIKGFSLQKLETAWDKKHFAAIFGCSKTRQAALTFAMLLRLSVASTRMNALQLFAAQGYFYALSLAASDVEDLARAMTKAIRSNENQALHLEGFLVSLDSDRNQIDLLPFGSHLAYRDHSGWEWIAQFPTLSNEQLDSTKISLVGEKEIILSVREYPLLLISGPGSITA